MDVNEPFIGPFSTSLFDGIVFGGFFFVASGGRTTGKNAITNAQRNKLKFKPASDILVKDVNVLFDRKRPVIRIPRPISTLMKIFPGKKYTIRLEVDKKKPDKIKCSLIRSK